ncbi:hypothetical protein [Levilactobacillus andaensis]|uniref:hypothetical protein n=1 Tax=Levilactobacillus andaensis TaxID=2799570 RepID=UPI0019430AF5|nr:hypothetical protein [Levilactobacillus andaensis]
MDNEKHSGFFQFDMNEIEHPNHELTEAEIQELREKYDIRLNPEKANAPENDELVTFTDIQWDRFWKDIGLPSDGQELAEKPKEN